MSNKVQQYFKDFPASPKAFETTDGTLFHQEGDANLHQKSLGPGKVTEHLRPIKEVVSAEVAEDKKEPAVKKAAAKKTAAKKSGSKTEASGAGGNAEDGDKKGE